jgi:hypothetical protein
MTSRSNLFSSLNRWASGQSENFLTEAFVQLLNRLLVNAPREFDSLIRSLTRDTVVSHDGNRSDIEIRSQASTELGSPDIEISGPDIHCFVEVKDGSPVNADQLRRYSEVLSSQNERTRCLVLLTRYPPPSVNEPFLVEPVRWSHVAEWLGELRADRQIDDATTYLLDQFLAFLEDKGMTAERVGWELISGLDQLMNLKVMMQEALVSAGAHRVWISYGGDFSGAAIPDRESNNSAYFLNIWHSDPGRIIFVTKEANVRPDRRAGWTEHPNGQIKRTLLIDSEGNHFFSRTLNSQRQLLEEFCADCLSDTTYVTEKEVTGGRDDDTDREPSDT